MREREREGGSEGGRERERERVKNRSFQLGRKEHHMYPMVMCVVVTDMEETWECMLFHSPNYESSSTGVKRRWNDFSPKNHDFVSQI